MEPPSHSSTCPRDDQPPLPIRHALALGLLHGPAELLPISSSAHITLVPWLARWPYAELDPAARKSFEVALHTGTAVALLARRPPAPRLRFLTAATAPPALAGYALHDRISSRLGTPATVAAGLIASSLATFAVEARARRCSGRSARDAGLADGLAVGLAQAAALWPGVSRSASAFSAARLHGFDPADSQRLSLAAGLPVLCGAALLKSSRALASGLGSPSQASLALGASSRRRGPLALGAGAALLSTLVAGRLLDERRRARIALPAAAYRACLATVVIARLRSRTRARRPRRHPPPLPKQRPITPARRAASAHRHMSTP
jgi:undecaprenyl-diphosphatase